MSEVAFIIDELNGTLLVEDTPDVNSSIREQLTRHLGTAQEMGCARPLVVLPVSECSAEEKAVGVCVRINGYYHNSLCEGPGRRGSVLFQSCPLRCQGCWVTHLHSEEAGALVPVTRLAAELLDPNYERWSKHPGRRTVCSAGRLAGVGQRVAAKGLQPYSLLQRLHI